MKCFTENHWPLASGHFKERFPTDSKLSLSVIQRLKYCDKVLILPEKGHHLCHNEREEVVAWLSSKMKDFNINFLAQSRDPIAKSICVRNNLLPAG